MIVVPDTASQPHAVVVETTATALTQFTVLGVLGHHYL